MIAQPLEPRPEQRLRGSGESRCCFQRGALTQRRGRADGVAQALEVARRLRHQPPGRCAVSTCLGDLAQPETRECRCTPVSCGDLGAQGCLELRLRTRMVIALEERSEE